jgi:hypothetical protein
MHKMMVLIQLENPVEVLTRQRLSETKIKGYLNQMAHYLSLEEKFVVREKLELLLAKGEDKNKKLNDVFERVRGELNGLVVNSELNPHSINIFEKTKFEWSEQLKSNTIKIKGVIAEQTGMQSNGQRFIMM